MATRIEELKAELRWSEVVPILESRLAESERLRAEAEERARRQSGFGEEVLRILEARLGLPSDANGAWGRVCDAVADRIRDLAAARERIAALEQAQAEQAAWSARTERDECLRDVDAESSDCGCAARIRRRIAVRVALLGPAPERGKP